MPRAKKVKLIDKCISELNGKELVQLIMFFGLHDPNSPFIKHTPMLQRYSCGIGEITLIRCSDCKVTKNITDYTCW